MVVLGAALFATPFAASYRTASQLLKNLFWLGGLLTFGTGTLCLLLGYDFYHYPASHQHFLGRGVQAVIVRSHQYLAGAVLACLLLLLSSPEVWALSRLTRRKSKVNAEAAVPVAAR